MIKLYRAGLPPPSMRCKKKEIDHINRLPDEILIHHIFDEISEAKHLFNLSMVSKRFASLIPSHSTAGGGTITLQLPNSCSLVSSNRLLMNDFIDSFKHFLKQFHYKHTLHIRLTREYYNVDIVFEFIAGTKSPQILILSSLIPTKEAYGKDHYYPLFYDMDTTQYFPPLFPGYNACGRWEGPLRRLLFDNDSDDTKEEERWKNEHEPLKNEYVGELDLPKSRSVMKRVLLSATRAAWGDDGVFFRNNTRGKDAVLLETVREVMNFYL